MQGESNKERGRLKGYMWEAVVLRLLQDNDFVEITTVDNIKTRKNRGYFLEMRGRGAWHQIDCPCDYIRFIPFVNPLRLLGEVKFHRKAVPKNLIREFIGTIKDIQENYFIPDFSQPSSRYTELGVYFSANGFDSEAEQLAFAHNIKTISHRNIEPLNGIKTQVEELERNYISAKHCISTQNQQEFIRLFREILSGDSNSISTFTQHFQTPDGFERVSAGLAELFGEIKASFVATSSGGALLHFIGTSSFPDELFANTDTALCRVFYQTSSLGRRFYMVFTDDLNKHRFYFSPPISLAQAAFFGGRAVLDEKNTLFREIHVSRRIHGLSRTLVLRLDQDWLDRIRRSYD